MRRARTEAAEAEILDVLFFKTGSDVCYISFADALQADWLIRNDQITRPVLSFAYEHSKLDLGLWLG